MIATLTPIGRVGTGVVVTTPSEREVSIARQFDAPRRLVFRTLTEPALVKRWMFGPESWSFAVCEIDLRVGGAFRYVWRHADGREMGLQGVYREIVRPDRIVNTQRFDGELESGESLVTTTLVEWDERTTMTMTVQYVSRQARDEAIESNMAVGLEAGFARVDELLTELLLQAETA